MIKLKLINPSIEYKNEVLIYRKEFIDNEEILNISGGLYQLKIIKLLVW